MKKSLLLLGLCCASVSFAQNNTLPTNGNVGIGTLTPSTRLEVNGNVKVDSCLIVQDSLIVMNEMRVEGGIKMNSSSVAEDNFKVKGHLKLPNAANVSQNAFENGGYNILLQESSNGKVKELDYVDFQSSVQQSAYAERPLGTSCEEGSPDLETPTWQNGLKKIFVPCPEVNVGIGTTIPAFSLHTNGDGYFSQNLGVGADPHPEVQLNASTTRKVGYCVDHNFSGDYGYAFKALVNKETTKGFALFNNIYNTEVFTVYGNGKIEVSNSTGKIWQLESNGLMRGRQIKLDLDNWADYVFAPNYQLMPLNELESYVQKENHLPNVPSESEIIEEGVDLGQMNVILLEKVEELTLYLIEQNKSNEELKTEIELLKKRLAAIESNQ